MSGLAKAGGTCRNLICAFCGKGTKEVAYLIEGPTAYICDQCVEACRKLGQEQPGNDVVRLPVAPKEGRR